MFPFKNLKITLVLLVLVLVSCSLGETPELKSNGYVITAEEDGPSEKWAEYLYRHLQKRSKDPKSIILIKGAPKPGPEGFKNIHFEVAFDLKNDYCIEHNSKRLHIRSRSEKTALWLIYELIESISAEDNRFSTPDLPPSIVKFEDGCKDFDFEYREPHFAQNLEIDQSSVFGNNNVETDWGLWGHQLFKVVQDFAKPDMFAMINGQRNPNQLCFSSQELYEGTRDYIIDNYGKGEKEGHKFMIMPNDNNLICSCHLCAEVGNTDKSATPAVADFIRKLVETFPKHQFYTTAYRTTQNAPEYQFAENSGIFFSTINLKKGIALNEDQKETKKFLEDIKKWGLTSMNMYLWDYGANFDDYLTPIPLLNGLQKQLVFFKDHHIKGIFLNGSGYDYMSFDDLKTFVASALMKDTTADVEMLITKFYKKNYPVSGNLLGNYFINLENSFTAKNKPYNMYGSLREGVKVYLDSQQFVEFYQQLKNIIPKTQNAERQKLEKLYTALSFTRLRLAYINGANKYGYADKVGSSLKVKPEIDTWISSLKNYVNYSDMSSYKETDGSIAAFIEEWNKIQVAPNYQNYLLDDAIAVLSEKDEGFEKTDLLNDGVPGFATDYHLGWYLNSSKNFKISFSNAQAKKGNKMRLRFLNLPSHNIIPPQKITISGNGKLIKSVSVSNSGENVSTVTIDVPFQQYQNIEISFEKKNQAKSIIAVDEIQVLN